MTTKRYDPSYANIRTMLRDAIIEYVGNREDGDVDAYMQKRYPHLFGVALDQKKQSVTSSIYHAKKAVNHIDAIAEFVVTKFDEDYDKAIAEHEERKAKENLDRFTELGLQALGQMPSDEQLKALTMIFAKRPDLVDASWLWSRIKVSKNEYQMRTAAEANNVPAKLPKKDDWLHVKVHMSAKQARKYIGEHCRTYEKGCPTCDLWREWDDTEHVTVLIDNDTLVKQLINGRV